MDKLRNYVQWFVYITTGVLLVVTVNMQLSGVESVSVSTLWDILISGLATTVVTVFFVSTTFMEKVGFALGTILHYIALCIVMIVLVNAFGWLSFSLKNAILMCVSVAAVYAFAFITSYITDKGIADSVNEQLQKKDNK